MFRNNFSSALALTAAVALLLGGAAPAASQRQDPAPAGAARQGASPEDQDEAISVNTNLVQADAVVLDKNGRQVTDLRADDFEIVEDGRARRPDHCSYVSVEGEGAPSAGADRRLGPNEVRRSIVFLVANPVIEIKNNVYPEERPFASPPTRSLLLAARGDAQAAAGALTRFVDGQMGPNDLAAVRESEGVPGSLTGLTADRSVLRRAVERVGLDPLKKGPKITIVASPSSVSLHPLVRQNLHVIRMMGDAVDQLEKLPGRRVIVLLSRGMLHGTRAHGAEEVRERMGELIEKANRARVTVYTLNPRGVDLENLRGGGLQDNGGLMILARETGGRAIFNTNDLSQGLAGVLEESRGYYQLAYNPGPGATARPRDVQVKVLRPGLRVQARRRAYPGAAPRGPAGPPRLAEVLGSPLAFRDIKLGLSPLFLSPDGKAAHVVSLVNIGLAGAERETREDGSQAINLEVVGRVTAPDGGVVYQRARSYSLSLPPAEAEKALERGVDYWFHLEANAPGLYEVSVAVRDVRSGRVGNETRFVEVADLARGRLSASSLFLSETAGPAAEAPSSFLKDEGMAAFSRSEFPAGGTLRYQCYVYNARPDGPARGSNLQAQVAIKRDGVTRAAGPARAVPHSDAPAFVGGEVQLGGLPPGLYTFEVTITDLNSRSATTAASSQFQITN